MFAATRLIFFSLLLAFKNKNLREPSDTVDFFPDIAGNLTKLTWAHAVNSASYLEEVLSGDLMMLEADIILGRLTSDPDILQPVMGHPPAETSDISLRQFLKRVNEFNSQTGASMKGVKLDFKSIEVFEMSLPIIDELYHQVQYPVWLNADILPGPIDSQGVPVDASRFLQGAKPYQSSMLSIGWTTRYGVLVSNGSYTKSQTDQMYDTLVRYEVKQKVTYPIRAGIAAQSSEVLVDLLERTSASPYNATFTIWSSKGDPVDIDRLRGFIFQCGLDRIYLDVPEEVSDQLDLGSQS